MQQLLPPILKPPSTISCLECFTSIYERWKLVLGTTIGSTLKFIFYWLIHIESRHAYKKILEHSIDFQQDLIKIIRQFNK